MSSKIDLSTKHYNMLINGEIISAENNDYFESINPSTGEVFSTVTNASVTDMERAIAGAKESFQKGIWRNFSAAERGVYLRKMAGLIRDNARELAELESSDVGKTAKQASFIDVPTCADCFEYFGSLSEAFTAKVNPVDAPAKSVTAYEPVGVVACIIPWNYPLIMAAWKLAPALMAGNSVILKPSPLGCVSIMRLAQIIADAGFPKGVVNIVSSKSVDTARLLAQSSSVNMISFTGGTETGKDVMRAAADNVKKVSLELGSKSPNIVFSDCDMEAAIGGTLAAAFMNQGQMCTAGSRLLLDERIYKTFLPKLVEQAKNLKIGKALDYETQFGPVISEDHRRRLVHFIEKAVSEGAKIECGGKIPDGQLYQNGFYLEPTIISNVSQGMDIVQEELFGPVLTVQKFSSVDEAVRLANDTKYGLAACVWSKDESIPSIVSKELQCGIVWVNTYGGFYNQASFGGYKQSGSGRELGLQGLLEYTQSKHICEDQTPGGKSLVTTWF